MGQQKDNKQRGLEKKILRQLAMAMFLLALMPFAPVSAETTATGTGTPHSAIPGYNPFQRPDPDGVPTQVSVDLFVYDLAHISDVDTTFSIDFFLILRWRDPRLAGGSKNTAIAYRVLQLDEVWNPRAIIANERELSRRFKEVVEVDPAGNVTYRQRYQGTLSFEHDLRNFPFDSHVLPIEIASRYGPEVVVFLADKIGRGGTLSIVDWQVGPGSAREGIIYIGAPFDDHHSSFYYELPVKRYKAFYIWKVIIPLSMIVFMSWTILLLDPSQVGPRIGISTASVLTLILFQFHLGKLVPWVSYFTRADYFSVGSTLLVFLALAIATFVTGMVRWGHESIALKIERWERLIFPVSFVVLFIFALLL